MDITDGICGGFDTKLSDTLGSFDQMYSAVKGPMNDLTKAMGKLSDVVPSSSNDITNGIGDIESAATAAVPDIPDVSDIESILQDCGLLQGDLLSGLSNVADLIAGYIEQAIGIVTDAISGVLDLLGDLLEAPAAFIMDQINKLLGLFGVGDLLSYLDGLINCLDSVCGSDVSGAIDHVNYIVEDLHLNDAGEFDLDKMVETMIADGKNIPAEATKNVKSLGDSLAKEATKAEEGVDKVATVMSEGMDKIIDANVDTTPVEVAAGEVVTVAQAVVEDASKRISKMKSFFT
jgi:hypothetical protein